MVLCPLNVLRVTLAVLLVALSALPARAAKTEGGYVVVVSSATFAKADWRKVADALTAKHGAIVCQYKTSPSETLPALKKHFPKYACFLATPGEAGRKFVAEVHQLTRKLDDDPYTDLLWGILTGYDAANALGIAKYAAPLTIKRVASGTDVALEMCAEGLWYCELKQHRMVRKRPGGKPAEEKGPADTTQALVDTLNVYKAQLFVTSGHATERDWQIGFRYRNGSFRCKDGGLYGQDTKRRRIDIKSPNAKVYLAVGNCLMGHINSPDAMALAWMNSAGVTQMVGYTVPTWFGYAGWGCLDYFVEQPGRYTMTEAFFANHHALVHKLSGASGREAKGLKFDRDVVAFYGDPAWEARMAPAPNAWEQKLTEDKGRFTFTITPKRGAKTFEPININGSQRGYRPIVAYLPYRIRIKDVKIIEGADLKPMITDNFLLIPNPRKCDPKRSYELIFAASKAK
jgi:zinc protease